MYARQTKGFTLVELIVVILLIAIVSAYAVSRYSGTASFAAQVAQEQVISVIRQVQVTRMQSNADAAVGNTNFVLVVNADCVGSQVGCANRVNSQSDWVSLEEVTFSPTVTIPFDLLGNPENGAAIINIRSTDGSCSAVIISDIGYVSRGTC